jgi:BirA family transcriptional regulator, biotin operon repressor / biotin---[acetyl-CoA-carboxylase] ligase
MKTSDQKPPPPPQELILEILSSGDFVSEETLTKRLGMTRLTFEGHITRLKEEGFKIESFSEKGYRLETVPDILFPNLILQELKTAYFGQKIRHFLHTDSTNIQARSWASEGAEEGALVVSEYQEKGKGRLNRAWQAPPGKNLLFSLILRPGWAPQKAFYGTVLASVSLCRAIQDIVGISAGIKWPNDLYVGNKKLAGILTEFAADSDLLEYMIIGIGVNCHWAPSELPPGGQPATSLLMEAGNPISRLLLLSRFLTYGEALYERTQKEGVGFLREEWNRVSLVTGRKVALMNGRASWTGLAQGINEQGGLILLLEDGRKETFLTGDVHLRFEDTDFFKNKKGYSPTECIASEF